MRAFITSVKFRTKRDKSQTMFISLKRVIIGIRDDDTARALLQKNSFKLPIFDPLFVAGALN